MKITKLFKILAIKVLKADNNKIIGGNNSKKVDKIIKNLFKFYKSKI